MPTNSRCFVTVKCNRTTAIGGTIQHPRAIDISPLSVAFRLTHQSECVLSPPSSLSPYAFSSLPCTRAGAPAYISSQRLACSLLPPSHSSTQTAGRSWPCDGHNTHIRGTVAGASFFAGAAGAPGGRTRALPRSPSSRKTGQKVMADCQPPIVSRVLPRPLVEGRVTGPEVSGIFWVLFGGNLGRKRRQQ